MTNENKTKKEEWFEIGLTIFFGILMFIGIKYLWGYFKMPDRSVIEVTIKTFFDTYGLYTVFVAAILESMLFIGWYFPGSLVIFLSVSSTYGSPIKGFYSVTATTLGMLLGYTLNYFAGKYGWYKLLEKFGLSKEVEKIKNRVNNEGVKASLLLYAVPGLGSLTSTVFGILKYNFVKFLSVTFLCITIWNIMWGVLAYNFGMKIFDLLTNGIGFAVIFAAMVIYKVKYKDR